MRSRRGATCPRGRATRFWPHGADAHRGIEAFVDEVDDAVGQLELPQLDRGMAAHELRRRRQWSVPNETGSTRRSVPRGTAGAFATPGFGFLEVSQQLH